MARIPTDAEQLQLATLQRRVDSFADPISVAKIVLWEMSGNREAAIAYCERIALRATFGDRTYAAAANLLRNH